MAYPALERHVQSRLPLLTPYYLTRQLSREIAHADGTEYGVPPTYRRIIAVYREVPDHVSFKALASASANIRFYPPGQAAVARLVLWRERLPGDFLYTDPIADITRQLHDLERKERSAAVRRRSIVVREALDSIRHSIPRPHYDRLQHVRIPDDVRRQGLRFCGIRIPLERPDVRRRIEQELAYLLTDFRATTTAWLQRKDRYAGTVAPILRTHDVPPEMTLLPALESGYQSKALSPMRAKGWWQFVRATATQAHTTDPALDWTLHISDDRDDRCDLVLSTRAAARHLQWLRSELKRSLGSANWLIVAAAYNAGFEEVRHRADVYGTDCYWDIVLPRETEQYVPRWIALALIDSRRRHFGIEVEPVAALEFDSLTNVRLAKDLPLSVLAIVTDSSVRFIKEINGGLTGRSNAVKAQPGPGRPGVSIHVPRGSGARVMEALEARNYLEKGEQGNATAQRVP
jgi:membrane-bound lytic murein transglycosylase D